MLPVPSPTITGNIITGNTAGTKGGGIHCYRYSSPTITGNTADQGGGIHCSSSSPTITGNTAGTKGGGIYCSSSSPTITGNTIAGNATEYGGSIYCYSSSPAITNCTITDNLAHNFGGGIYCTNQSSPTIVNCILWACSPDEIYVHSGRPLVTYSDIKGGWEGEGNTDCDPWFCYPDTGNYYLAENSCCIGAGQGGANMGALGIGCDAYLLFIRADANADSAITIGDAIYTIKYLCIPGSPAPVCMKSADSDDSGDIAMSDAVYTLECLFVPGTPQPPAPFPSCGVDATEDGLDCASYPPCGTGESTRTNQITASR